MGGKSWGEVVRGVTRENGKKDFQAAYRAQQKAAWKRVSAEFKPQRKTLLATRNAVSGCLNVIRLPARRLTCAQSRRHQRLGQSAQSGCRAAMRFGWHPIARLSN